MYGLVYGLSGNEEFRGVENKKPPDGGCAKFVAKRLALNSCYDQLAQFVATIPGQGGKIRHSIGFAAGIIANVDIH